MSEFLLILYVYVIDTDTPTFILVVGCGNDLVQPIQINDPPIVLLQQSKISNSI